MLPVSGTQSSGLWQFLETGAMTKFLHAGRAAEAGLMAAELAEVGLTGPPAILEGLGHPKLCVHTFTSSHMLCSIL